MTSNSEQHLVSQAKILIDYARSNASHFSYDFSENGKILLNASLQMRTNLEGFAEKLLQIEAEAHRFDFDKLTPANGFRSYVKIGTYALGYGINLNKEIIESRSSLLFRKSKYAKHLLSYSQLLHSLQICFRYVEKVLSWSTSDCLFTGSEHTFNELFAQESINLLCFYGRCMGFQFSNETRQVLNSILTSMTAYSTYLFSEGSFFAKLKSKLSTPKYYIDEEQRAKQLINIFQNVTPEFCKSYWKFSGSSLLNSITFSNRITVNKVLKIEPKTLILEVDGRNIEILAPVSHIGERRIQVRLISAKKYKGMTGTSENDESLNNPSQNLIIHCHSGGFGALTSRSHLDYLKNWAKEIDVPILSIDYSLAPKAHYPRALEEVVYVYCWVLKNLNILGTTGDRIVLVGDSTGGNIILAATLKCVALGVPLPSGLCPVYAHLGKPLLPFPGRLLSVLDPLIPFTFLMICFRAYMCGNNCAFYSPIQKASKKNKSSPDLSTDSGENKTTTSTVDSPDSNENKVEDLFTEISLEPTTVDSVSDINQPSTSTYSPSQEDPGEYKTQEIVETSAETFSKAKIFDFARFMQFPNLADDPFLCPLLASDEDLKKFPPVKAVTAEMDPFIDDNIVFCKKLKNLGKSVSLEVLPQLGHGFLNLSNSSSKAFEGGQVVVAKLSELLNLARTA